MIRRPIFVIPVALLLAAVVVFCLVVGPLLDLPNKREQP